MQTKLRIALAGVFLLASFCQSAQAQPNGRAIDGKKSSIIVHVYKTGFFSALAHNHEIEAPIDSGEVIDTGQASVEISVDARKLRVLDQEVSAGTRAQIQKTMLSPQVLDADRYPAIRFHSTAVEPKGAGQWLVSGRLELHGQKRPLSTVVALKDGLYVGSLALKQTDFGITPVAVAGGTVKVKDEVRIEFQIAPSH